MNRNPDPLAPYRSRLLGLAYRMLGSRADAEDVLQDAYLRFRNAQAVGNPEAFLVTIVTRLCLDGLKSARAQREVYVGTWLPEPVLDADALSPQTAAELADDLSFALLLALERLSPAERAAFLLHDVFDLGYADVAAVLDRSEAACRQLASRARKTVRSARPRAAPVSDEAHGRLLMAFGQAVSTGDEAGLAALFREDAVYFADGGGVKVSALNPIYGPAKIARFFVRTARKAPLAGVEIRSEPRTINGALGVLTLIESAIHQTFSMDVKDGKIAAIYVVSNPEKLDRLH